MSKQFWSQRILDLPPYIFSDLDKAKTELKKAGVDLIDLSIGDPDLATPKELVSKCFEYAADQENHRYPSYQGHPELRKSIATWFKKRFSVELDVDHEILVLIGSKEGIAHAPLAFLNPGDVSLVPDIRYPVYATTSEFAGAKVYEFALKNGERFLPDWSNIPQDVAQQSKLLFINYPNNPTSEVADRAFFEKTINFAKENQILVLHDNAYSETYTDEAPLSILQIPGAKEQCVEFHSLSKSFNMTGWRLGFAVGNRDAIAALAKVKQNIDSSQFNPIQLMGAYGLYNSDRFIRPNNEILKKRVTMVSESLQKLGIEFNLPKATFYFWCKVPNGFSSSAEFCKHMLNSAHVVFTPGNGFGKGGEGYFRISVTSPEHKIAQALERLEGVMKNHA